MVPFLVILQGRLDLCPSVRLLPCDFVFAYFSFATIGLALSLFIFIAGLMDKLNNSLAVYVYNQHVN